MPGNTALPTMNLEWASLKIPSPESRTAPCDREPLSHIDRGLELKLFGNPRGPQEIDFLPSVDAGLGSHVTLNPFGAGERVSLDICSRFIAIESAPDKAENENSALSNL